MATPILIVQQANINIVPGTPGSLRIDTFGADGNALSVASGYTADFALVSPSQSPNPLVAPVDIISNMSKAFDATGVTLSYTGAQAATIAGLLATLNNSVGIALSNDTGTTVSLVASGSLTVAAEPQFAQPA